LLFQGVLISASVLPGSRGCNQFAAEAAARAALLRKIKRLQRKAKKAVRKGKAVKRLMKRLRALG